MSLPQKKNLDIKVFQIRPCVSKMNLLFVVVALSSNHQTASALRLSTNLLNVEPYDPKLLQWHIALLVESDKSIELFKISHRLININPEDWHGWYAAGCYYLSIRKFEKAAELLRKSLTKEPSAGLAYLALGHAFSSEKEHDQENFGN